MKKSLIFLFSLLFFATSCYKSYEIDFSRYFKGDDSGPDNPDIEVPDGLMIMSSNMRYYQGTVKGQDTGDHAWEKRRKGYYKMVNTMHPTIMGVQEAEMNQVSDVVSNCPGYAYIGVGRTDGESKGESTSIFYKTEDVSIEEWGTFWLSDTPDVPGTHFPGTDSPRCATWAVVKLKKLDKEYFHVNTHTSYESDPLKKEVKLLVEMVGKLCPEGIPVMMTADWNVEEDDPALAEIFAASFISARKEAKVSDNQYTFSAWSTSSKQHLDHIFLKGMGKVQQFTRVPAVWETYAISDHYPVYTIAEFVSAPVVVNPPVADFSFPDNLTQDEKVKFEDKSTSDAGIESWSWNIGGILSNETSPEVLFRFFGEDIPVTLNVIDVYGQRGSVTKNISVKKAEGHDLTIEWSREYDNNGGRVYWTSPALNVAEDRVYVASTGQNLVCFDPSGTEIGRFDIGMYHPYMTDDLNRQMATPAIDKEGNIYIPVQYGYSTSGNGGLFSIMPDCEGLNWYFPTGAQSQYEFNIVAIIGDYLFFATRNVDSSLQDGQLANANIIKRTSGEFVQNLMVDKGSYGGTAVSYAGNIIVGSARGSSSESGGGFKVCVIDGQWGKWKTSPNTDSGRKTNLLGMKDSGGNGYQTKGCQPTVGKDGSAYVCLTSTGENMVVARYMVDNYVHGVGLEPVWKQEIEATVARNGHGIVLDSEGNAYVQSGNKVFRLNAADGSHAWTYETESGNCGMPAIDDLGYVYICDFHGHKLLKLSPDNGSVISEVAIQGPRSCPTIGKDGSIYVNAGGPTLYKVTCPKTKSHGDNWSQLGGNPQKTCTPPGATYQF
mgnify:CR=1 FL=1